MKMRKKAIAVLLAFAVALALAPVVPAKADGGPVTITLYYGGNHDSTLGGDALKNEITSINSIESNSVTISNFSSGSANHSISFSMTFNSDSPTVGGVKRKLGDVIKTIINNTLHTDVNESFCGVALYPLNHYSTMANIKEVWAAEATEDSTSIDGDRSFYALWANQMIDEVSLTVNRPNIGEEIGGSGDNRHVPSIMMGHNTYSITPYNTGSGTIPSAYWYDNSLQNMLETTNAESNGQYGVKLYLIPKLGYYFSDSISSNNGVSVTNAALDSVALNYNSDAYTDLSIDMNNITAKVPTPPAPYRPSTTSNYTPDPTPEVTPEPTVAPTPSPTPGPYVVVDADTPETEGTFPYGTDVRSKLPASITIYLSTGETRIASMSWVQKSVSRSKEIYTGRVVLPSDVSDPFERLNSIYYEATITHKDIISIDNGGRPLTEVAVFSEKDKVDDIYLPKTLTAHITDGTTYDIVPSWTLISQTETELKYETAINSAALLVDGIENPRQIGKVEFTVTLMDKPKGKFDLREYGGEFTVPYSNSVHRVELKTNDKGEITFSSDDKEVVTVKNKAGYGYDDNCIITLIKPGTTTVRAYIDGIEVDSMEVVVNKLDQDLKVTYKGKSSVTFKADDLKKEMKKITLTIKGVKTKITATKSSTSLYFIPSTKMLTLYKGIKKGDYTLKVKAEADKYYNSKSVKFTIHIE